ncbi:MAG: MBOAT family protein [Victivallaceae bacterium]|nr:MBOAT family protein [Victivallaceae bacterium]
MLFSSLFFLHIFLPAVLLIYFLLPKNGRNWLLLAASLFFYAWGEPEYLSIMLFSILLNYGAALLIGKAAPPATRKIMLSAGVVINLAFLFYFKYMDFFIANANNFFGTHYSLFRIIMPIGISFYTFQSISYLVDVYRRDVEPDRNLRDVALYISFFPQLIAGPIVKYHDIAEQLKSRRETLGEFAFGARRFLFGLAKKVLIANILGEYVDARFATGGAALSTADVWLTAAAYGLQLFYDFSGYSDMAIGLGHMFGFTIPENFAHPYMAKSITEFWRRWHISLSTWFKEYLYIPLGGNRVGNARLLCNLGIVFLLTGFWHGADWTFLLWGAWHGFFIIVERVTGMAKKQFVTPLARIGAHLYLSLAVFLGWVLFRAEGVPAATAMFKKMFSLSGTICPTGTTMLFWIAFAAGVLFSVDLFEKLAVKFDRLMPFRCATYLLALALGFLVLCRLAASTYNPFIYFRF